MELSVGKLIEPFEHPADPCGGFEKRSYRFVVIQRIEYLCDKFRHIHKFEPGAVDKFLRNVGEVCGIEFFEFPLGIKFVELFEPFCKERESGR